MQPRHHRQILLLVGQCPDLTASEIGHRLHLPIRNNLSDLINRSCLIQNPETFGFAIAPGGRYLLKSEQP